MGTDLRVRYTNKVIKDALIALLREKPLRSITVRKICELAGVNRTTFYKHFRDIYDVFEQVEEDAAQGLVDLIEQYYGRNSQDVLLLILHTIRDHREEFAPMLQREEGQNLLYRMAMAAYRKLRERAAADGAAGRFPASALHFGYYAGGIGGVLGYWIGNGMKESPEEIAQEIRSLSAPLWKDI